MEQHGSVSDADGQAPALRLAVPQGSFFGLVGPNGAGKTTRLIGVLPDRRPAQPQA